MDFPGRKAPVVCKLKIVRIEVILGREDRYLIGSAFFDINEEDKAFVASCLEKLNLYTVLEKTLKVGASDLHLTVGHPPTLRIQGGIRQIKDLSDTIIKDGEIKAMLYPLLSNLQIEHFEKNKELDFAFSFDINSRFRINLHLQRGFLEAVLRNIPTTVLSFEQLGLPPQPMEDFCREKSGLILIAGTTGSGKTTTMASMVDFMNKNF